MACERCSCDGDADPRPVSSSARGASATDLLRSSGTIATSPAPPSTSGVPIPAARGLCATLALGQFGRHGVGRLATLSCLSNAGTRCPRAATTRSPGTSRRRATCAPRNPVPPSKTMLTPPCSFVSSLCICSRLMRYESSPKPATTSTAVGARKDSKDHQLEYRVGLPAGPIHGPLCRIQACHRGDVGDAGSRGSQLWSTPGVGRADLRTGPIRVAAAAQPAAA